MPSFYGEISLKVLVFFHVVLESRMDLVFLVVAFRCAAITFCQLLEAEVNNNNLVLNPGWSFDIGDYTTQLYGDCNKLL